MSAANRTVFVCHLGKADYRKTWELQKSIQRRLVEEKRNNPRHQVPHVLLTVEHPPVYTLGKSGDDSNLLINDHDLSALGASFVHIDRGGDITFHGPGQLVAYPILDLGHFYTDIHRYLRELEQVVILTCAAFGLATGRVHGLTGVWTRSTESLASRKICSMGIKCSRWVTSHGLALNVHTDPNAFTGFRPCGLSPDTMTRVADHAEIPPANLLFEVLTVKHVCRVFGMELPPPPEKPAGDPRFPELPILG